MKTKLLLFVCATFGALQINAQCSRSGSFMQSDPAYSISGTGGITFELNGDKNVVFDSNFMTVQGVDLRVYLSKTDDILAVGSDAIEVTTSPLLGDNGMTSPVLSPITGMKTFVINQTLYPNVNLSTYDYVVIQCIGINERWGYVNMAAANGPDCNLLSVAEKSLQESIAVYPNPANDYFEITNNSPNPISVNIYDILGNRVITSETSRLKKQSFSLANLNSGVYLVELKSDNQKLVKKLIKR
ncbi:T9SS type A sorting domain-containing protein [Kordia sp.]|uniref:T9SS type A sorting domain-containing protein n=1 Tax=Kordia sp. TaxID=1965332 RepID=UPI003D283AE2